jgi:hypothetical protein
MRGTDSSRAATSRAVWQRLPTDRLFVPIVLVAHRGDLITETLDLVVSVTASYLLPMN